MANSKRTKAATMPEDRLPPHSVEMEAAVLGCCLADPKDALGVAQEALPDDTCFYDLKNRMVWVALREVASAHQTPDVIAVMQWLKDHDKLEEVGVEYLLNLPDNIPSALNLPAYLPTVRDKWLMRRMLTAVMQGATMIYEDQGQAHETLAAVEKSVMDAGAARIAGSQALSMAELIPPTIEHLEESFSRGKKYRVGPQTPWNYVNNMVPGFGPGELVVIAGRPGDGKSCVVMQLAEHVAITEGVPVAVFSLEMTARALVIRALFQRAGANLTKFRNGFMINADFQKLTCSASQFNKSKFWIESAARMAIEDIEVKARRMRRQYGIGLFIVDYLQLLYLRFNPYRGDRVQELANVSMRLKALAMELGVPIVCCAQMNRNIEVSDRKRKPMLSDLRDCGQIEQDADIVGMLYHAVIHDKHNPEDRDMQWLKRMSGLPPEFTLIDTWDQFLNRTNLYIAKQREGPTGDCSLVFVKPWCRFVDAWRPEKEPEQQEIRREEEDEL